MRTSEHTDQLYTALASAQTAIKPPVRESTGQARGGRYQYADLGSVIEAARLALAKHGVTVAQEARLSDDASRLIVTTRLAHASGQWQETEHSLVVYEDKQGPQDIGALVTYGRRYSLSAALGLASEEDDDAASVQSSESKRPVARKAESAKAEKPLSQQLADLGIDEATISRCGLDPRANDADRRALAAALPRLRAMSATEIGADPAGALAEALEGGVR